MMSRDGFGVWVGIPRQCLRHVESEPLIDQLKLSRKRSRYGIRAWSFSCFPVRSFTVMFHDFSTNLQFIGDFGVSFISYGVWQMMRVKARNSLVRGQCFVKYHREVFEMMRKANWLVRYTIRHVSFFIIHRSFIFPSDIGFDADRQPPPVYPHARLKLPQQEPLRPLISLCLSPRQPIRWRNSPKMGKHDVQRPISLRYPSMTSRGISSHLSHWDSNLSFFFFISLFTVSVNLYNSLQTFSNSKSLGTM